MFREDDLPFVQNMVWMMSGVASLIKTEHSKLGSVIWDKGIGFYGIAVPILFRNWRRLVLDNAYITILHGMADPLLAGRRMSTRETKFVELNNFVL